MGQSAVKIGPCDAIVAPRLPCASVLQVLAGAVQAGKVPCTESHTPIRPYVPDPDAPSPLELLGIQPARSVHSSPSASRQPASQSHPHTTLTHYRPAKSTVRSHRPTVPTIRTTHYPPPDVPYSQHCIHFPSTLYHPPSYHLAPRSAHAATHYPTRSRRCRTGE